MPELKHVLIKGRFAELLGKTQSYISKIESGQLRIDVIQLKELAKVYKKDMGHFLKD